MLFWDLYYKQNEKAIYHFQKLQNWLYENEKL
jgi:hypothetical protein